jgi:phosphate starvation-inducible PhoH-like protein
MVKKKTSQEKVQNQMDDFIDIMIPKRVRFKAKNVAQKNYARLITDSELVICSGPAGTGKSYTSIARGIELLQNKTNKYRKLIICTPAVEAEEKLGHLPGTLEEKIAPFLASSISIIDKILGQTTREKLVEQSIIEVEALAFIRGKTIDNAVFIMEEAQNMSPNQMKTLLTRIGENTKFVISGDLEQSDKYRSGKESGLADALKRLRPVEEIGFFEFSQDDIVRNPIISKILKHYNVEEPKKELLNENKNSKKVITKKSRSIGPTQTIVKDDIDLENIKPLKEKWKFSDLFKW